MTYLIKFNKLILFIILLSVSYESRAIENKIIYKINNEIITSFDLNREFKYLALINPKILELKKDEIFNISKNSIIREKIKKIEILKHIDSIKIDNNYLNELVNQNFLKLGLKNIDEFKKKLVKLASI